MNQIYLSKNNNWYIDFENYLRILSKLNSREFKLDIYKHDSTNIIERGKIVLNYINTLNLSQLINFFKKIKNDIKIFTSNNTNMFNLYGVNNEYNIAKAEIQRKINNNLIKKNFNDVNKYYQEKFNEINTNSKNQLNIIDTLMDNLLTIFNTFDQDKKISNNVLNNEALINGLNQNNSINIHFNSFINSYKTIKIFMNKEAKENKKELLKTIVDFSNYLNIIVSYFIILIFL